MSQSVEWKVLYIFNGKFSDLIKKETTSQMQIRYSPLILIEFSISKGLFSKTKEPHIVNGSSSLIISFELTKNSN